MTWAVEKACENAGQKLVLLLLANHSNQHTGRCDPSHSKLAKECSMGVATLKRHLQRLSDLGFIEIVAKSSQGVSLPNQYHLNLEGVGPNRADPGPNRTEGVGPNRATKQESFKQERNQQPRAIALDGFDAFYSAYPRKVNKPQAQKAWAKIKPSEHQAITEGLTRWKASRDWAKDDGQFIPHPATWLNGRRWEDDVMPAEAKQSIPERRPLTLQELGVI